MKYLISTLFLVLYLSTCTNAQVFQILQEQVCWTTPALIDSSLNKYVLISSLDSEPPRTLSYTNGQGQNVDVNGGNVNNGYCCCDIVLEGGIDQISILEDSIIVLYDGNEEITRDTLNLGNNVIVSNGLTDADPTDEGVDVELGGVLEHDTYITGVPYRLFINKLKDIEISANESLDLAGIIWARLASDSLIIDGGSHIQVITPNVHNNIAQNGQVLTLIDAATGEAEYTSFEDNHLGTHDQFLTEDRLVDFDDKRMTYDVTATPIDDWIHKYIGPIDSVGWWKDDGLGLKLRNNTINSIDGQTLLFHYNGSDKLDLGNRHKNTDLEGDTIAVKSEGQLIIQTPNVHNNIAQNGQVLTLLDESTGEAEYVNLPDAYLGEIAYINDQGEDLTGVIGNPFKPFETLSGVSSAYTPTQDELSIIASQDTTAMGVSTFLTRRFSYEGKNGNVLTMYNGLPLRAPALNSKSVVIRGDMDIRTDTINRGSYFLNSSTLDANTNLIIDVNNVYAAREVLNAYGRNFVRGYFKNIAFKAREVSFLSNTLIDAIDPSVVDIQIGKVTLLDKPTNRYLESILMLRPSSRSTSTVNLEIQEFINDGTSNQKRGAWTFGGTYQDTFFNSTFDFKIFKYFSKKIMPRPNYTAYTSSSYKFYPDLNLRNKFVNSVINVTTQDAEGSHTLYFFSNDNNNGDFDNTTLNYSLTKARVRYALFDTPLGHELLNNSLVNFNCEDCLVTEDVLFKQYGVKDASSKIVISGRLETANKPVVFSNSDFHLEDAMLFNDGSLPLIESSTPITVYACNTNLTRDRVHANVNLVFCTNEGEWQQEAFTATAAQASYTTSTNSLPTNTAQLIVVVDGLERIEGAGEYYTYDANTGIITFTTPLVGGEKVKVRWYA